MAIKWIEDSMNWFELNELERLNERRSRDWIGVDASWDWEAALPRFRRFTASLPVGAPLSLVASSRAPIFFLELVSDRRYPRVRTKQSKKHQRNPTTTGSKGEVEYVE